MTPDSILEEDQRIEDMVEWLLDQSDCEGPMIRDMRGALVAAFDRGAKSARPEARCMKCTAPNCYCESQKPQQDEQC
jgi:hypothetical protein